MVTPLTCIVKAGYVVRNINYATQLHRCFFLQAKRVPLRSIFRVGNSQKSLGARPGEYGDHFYVQVLQRLHEAVRRKRRGRWQEEWFLYHDNAPSHTSPVVQQFLAEKSISVITQPPYSPDLAPSDFWLFPTLKIGLKGTRFATLEGIKSNATTELRKIPKEGFRRCFQQWQGR